jgi:putative ABC transport system permease protein
VTELYGDLESANSTQLVVRNAVSVAFPMPDRYGERIRQIPGVKAVSGGNWFRGTYVGGKGSFANYACDPEFLLQVFPESHLPADQAEAFIKDRRAAVAGQKLVQRFGWKLGDHITLRSTLYQCTLEFVLRGIYTHSKESEEMNFFFHRDYLEEATGRPGRVTYFWVRVDSPPSLAGVANAIDEAFRNADPETTTESEIVFRENFISTWADVKSLVLWISMAIIFTILMMASSTLGMAVRGRAREIAILRMLGFDGSRILALLIGEAVMTTLWGGVIGTGGAWLFYRALDLSGISNGLFPTFRVTSETLLLGLGIALLTGIVSVAVPAYRFSRIIFSDGVEPAAAVQTI